MDDRAKQHAIEALVKMLLEFITPDMMNSLAEHLLAYAEEMTKKTSNGIDDVIINAMCDKIRQGFNITKS